jgi:hypothetical protein
LPTPVIALSEITLKSFAAAGAATANESANGSIMHPASAKPVVLINGSSQIFLNIFVVCPGGV